MTKNPRLGAALLLLGIGGGCGSDTPTSVAPCDCASTAKIQMLVITDFGAPVPNISPTITMRRSNEILDVQQDGLDAGIVTIIDDSHRSRLFTGGDSLLVALTRDSWSRSVDFIVGLDQACDCHVTKISGPSILMWP